MSPPFDYCHKTYETLYLHPNCISKLITSPQDTPGTFTNKPQYTSLGNDYHRLIYRFPLHEPFITDNAFLRIPVLAYLPSTTRVISLMPVLYLYIHVSYIVFVANLYQYYYTNIDPFCGISASQCHYTCLSLHVPFH